MAGKAEANRGGPHGLLKLGKSPTRSTAILNTSGDSLKSVEVKTPTVWNKMRWCLKIVAENS
jgi:hypothetical protein